MEGAFKETILMWVIFLSYMVYAGLESNTRHINVKHGSLEIELAVQRWYLATNANNNPSDIEGALIFAGRDEGLETHVEATAYSAFGNITPGYVAIYHRGRGAQQTVPEEVILEAETFLSKDSQSQRNFLEDFHRQVMSGQGSYAAKFDEGMPEIAVLSNYFADKMSEAGLARLSEEVLSKINGSFPTKCVNVYLPVPGFDTPD